MENPYYQLIEAKALLKNQPIVFVSKPNMAGRDFPSPTDLLLGEHFHAEAGDRVVFFGCGNGALAAYLGLKFSTCHFWLSDLTCLALDCTQRTLEMNGVANAFVYDDPTLLPERQNTFDVAILITDKGRKLARKLLTELFYLLRRGGRLFLAGSNALGIQSVISDAEDLFGAPARILGYKKGNRLAMIEKQAPSVICRWAEEPGIAPGTWYTFTAEVNRQPVEIYSLPGVFSYDRIDAGTALLLNALPGDLTGRILDVGCGYGIIGIAVAITNSEKMLPETQIDMVDHQIFAVASAQRTLSANQPKIHPDIYHAIRIFPKDLMYQLDEHAYDYVLSNPPFHTGKIVDHTVSEALIQQAQRVLRKEGSLLVVANLFLRYEKQMKKYFKEVKVVLQNNRFHVLHAKYPR